MVDAITGFIVNKLGDYLITEALLLLGVKDEVEGLKKELALIQSYLKDVEEDVEGKSYAVTEWVEQVRDIAYEAEDILDNYVLNVQERHSSTRRFLDLAKRWSCIISEKAHAHSIAGDISSLRQKIKDLSRKFETYCKQDTKGTQKASISKRRQLMELRRSPPFIDKERIVGLKDDIEILLEKLLDGDSRTYMISIFGTGGLGKTALARVLYNCSEVKTRFDYRGWTCVTQEYETKDLLLSIIKSFGQFTRGLESMAKEDLEAYLRNLLQRKRYLVVIDDVWEREAWESLKRAFPQNENGSKVIMTTRIQAVAEGADERVFAYKLRFLTFVESYILFRQKVFGSQQKVEEDLEELGRDMVRKCRGLPLAIIVLAGVLSKKNGNEWYDVREHLWQCLKDGSIHISSVLDLSFNDLDHELKLCFLYLSIFPGNFEINVQKLIRLLVAEGFIQENDKIPEVMAEDYIAELIDKSLVQAEGRDRGKVKTCRVHDLLRELAVKKAKELHFLNVYNGIAPSPKCRREVVYHHHRDSYFSESRLNPQMHSFLFLRENEETTYYINQNGAVICQKLKLLRVLDLQGCVFTPGRRRKQSLQGAISKLIHLRYLGITYDNICDLSASISSLRCLQTLDASGSLFDRKIDLHNLTSLRHLLGVFEGELFLGDVTNLRTLKRIASRSWSKINQEKLINLRELEITDQGIKEHRKDVWSEMGSFSKLTSLRVLTVRTFSFNFSSAELPPSIESLTLDLSKLEDDPIPVLEKLPRLEELVIWVLHYPTKKLVCSAKGFLRLKTLEIGISGLEKVHIEDDAMPNLMKWDHILHPADNPNFDIPERLRAKIYVDHSEWWEAPRKRSPPIELEGSEGKLEVEKILSE